MKPLSLVLLGVGALAVVAGMFVWLGLGAALVAAGLLAILAEWLVPDR